MNLNSPGAMERNRSLAHAGYLVGALLFAIPLWDAAVRVWPLQFGNEQWRFRIVGSLASITLIPMIGVFVGLATATYAGSERARRSIGVFCLALAVVVAGLAAVFIVDYLQLRSTFPPPVQHSAMLLSSIAVAKFAVTALVLVLLGLGGRMAMPANR